MTILEAITHIDKLKPNVYSRDDKIRWLSILDGTVRSELTDTHEGSDVGAFGGYTPRTNLQTELLVPHPYDDIYIKWLEAQIDYANGEYGKYNNSITMFNTAYAAYEAYYHKNHRQGFGGSWTNF